MSEHDEFFDDRKEFSESPKNTENRENSDRETSVNGEKCPGCGNNMQFDPTTGKLKCPSCGREQEIFAEAGEEIAFAQLTANAKGGWQNETHIYHCSNCNAEEVLDKREIAHVCPFCGSPSVVERTEIDALKPNAVLPFVLTKAQASEIACKWAKKRLFSPKKFKTFFLPEEINGVYLPAFTFDADTYSVYRGELGEHYTVTVHRDGKEETETRTRYFHVSGEYREFFDDIAVSATDVVPESTMKKVMRCDYHNCVEYKEDFLYGFSAMLYTKSGEACWADAQKQAEREIRRGILAKYNYDTVEYLHVKTSYSNRTYKYLLLPIYLGNYKYKEKSYSFYINGRSGKLKGKAPVSPARVSIAVVSGLVLAVGVCVLGRYLGLW